jgi:hypothetical protein
VGWLPICHGLHALLLAVNNVVRGPFLRFLLFSFSVVKLL